MKLTRRQLRSLIKESIDSGDYRAIKKIIISGDVNYGVEMFKVIDPSNFRQGLERIADEIHAEERNLSKKIKAEDARYWSDIREWLGTDPLFRDDDPGPSYENYVSPDLKPRRTKLDDIYLLLRKRIQQEA